MPKILTFFHTAAVHCDTFDALRDRIAPGLAMHHNIRSSWLSRAQDGVDPVLAAEIRQEVTAARQPAICSCTTIGPVAESAGAIRIDQPMMQAAAQRDGPIVMVYCLESTREPSLDLLQTELLTQRSTATVDLLPLTELWPLFQTGETGKFEVEIARAVRAHTQGNPDPGCVVLAQASMAGAATWLEDLPCPVLSSPELALRAGMARL